MAIFIEDLSDPRIAPFTTLRARRTAEGLEVLQEEAFVVAEGEKGVRTLLQSDLEVVAFLGEPAFLSLFTPLLDHKKVAQERRYLAEAKLLQGIVGYKMHQGVMALGIPPQQTPLQQLPAPVVVLNRLANAENVGAVIRNAVAFGIKSILIDGATPSPFLRRSIKVAMGAVFQIAWTRVAKIEEALEELQKRGVSIVATDLSEEAVPLFTYCFPKEYALVLGSEGKGVDEQVVAKSDAVVTIPIASFVDSLNVAAASAVLLYHAQLGGRPFL